MVSLLFIRDIGSTRGVHVNHNPPLLTDPLQPFSPDARYST